MSGFTLEQWAARWGVPAAALRELQECMAADALPEDIPAMAKTEMDIQNLVRLEGAAKAVTLWRNNVGVLQDDRGRPVRFGLANDNPKLNVRLKSGDLIGWRTVIITPDHVGRMIAQFVSRECKKPGWKYTGTDREEAQGRWAALVNAAGGDAGFAAAPGTLT